MRRLEEFIDFFMNDEFMRYSTPAGMWLKLKQTPNRPQEVRDAAES